MQVVAHGCFQAAEGQLELIGKGSAFCIMGQYEHFAPIPTPTGSIPFVRPVTPVWSEADEPNRHNHVHGPLIFPIALLY
jgi:hypothetical protein